jgi:hypothetical protein
MVTMSGITRDWTNAAVSRDGRWLVTSVTGGLQVVDLAPPPPPEEGEEA